MGLFRKLRIFADWLFDELILPFLSEDTDDADRDKKPPENT